ncbi:hypothetical protein C8J57DRAFT_1044772, partial [Mycena rebaudengoi]
GVLPCVSYGGIEKTQSDGFQQIFLNAQTQSTSTAAAIASGTRGRDLWTALGVDFGVWMAVRPDLWPSNSLEVQITAVQLDSEFTTPFHSLPAEILIQILPCLSLADLISTILVSRSVARLIIPMLDETLWNHVHYGDLRWILPVPAVQGEVERAHKAAATWALIADAHVSPFDSRDFPFLQFVMRCSKDNSMRNRRRLWDIYKQYKGLWDVMEQRSGYGIN